MIFVKGKLFFSVSNPIWPKAHKVHNHERPTPSPDTGLEDNTRAVPNNPHHIESTKVMKHGKSTHNQPSLANLQCIESQHIIGSDYD